jgi:hypothetical protein
MAALEKCLKVGGDLSFHDLRGGEDLVGLCSNRTEASGGASDGSPELPGPLEGCVCKWPGLRPTLQQGSEGRPGQGRQGQLQGAADQVANVEAARGSIGHLAQTEGNDSRLGRLVPPV